MEKKASTIRGTVPGWIVSFMATSTLAFVVWSANEISDINKDVAVTQVRVSDLEVIASEVKQDHDTIQRIAAKLDVDVGISSSLASDNNP